MALAASLQKAVLWSSVVRKEGCVLAGIKESLEKPPKTKTPLPVWHPMLGIAAFP